MGRPIKAKYFGKYNEDKVGGEAVWTDTTGNVNATFSNRGATYYSANVSATISAPIVQGGTTAVVDTVHLFANGAVKAVHLSNDGSGYKTAPTITFFGANATPAAATANIYPATTTVNTIEANCWIAGDTRGRLSEIVRQVGARRFQVETSTPYAKGKCKLVTTANPAAAGEMTITATFVDASTFNVAKITDRLVYSATGERYKWVMNTTGGSAANVSATDITVTISSH
jgi:hypothetical protein